jgi:phage terminase large subunit-like protein
LIASCRLRATARARSRPRRSGIDGGGLDDFLGLALIGRERGTQRWMLWTMTCCHEKALERRKDIKTMVQGFAQSGEVLICRSGEEDIGAVADIIEQVWSRGLFPEKNAVGLDPVGVAAIMDELMARELPEDMLVGVPQGYKLSGVTKGMARKVDDGSLVHGGSGLMSWCIGNAKTEKRGNADYVTKQASGSMKIDPLIAAFNAFDLMSRHPDAAGGPSVYEDRGILFL